MRPIDSRLLLVALLTDRQDYTDLPDIELIDSQSELDAYARHLQGVRQLALDTEFVRETTYYADLCLMQLGTTDSIRCIDYVAELDYTPLHDELARQDLCWVAHSARQDLEVFWHAAKAMPKQLEDTQIGAGLLGYPPQIGLQDIVRQLLGIELSKAHTRTDWRRRPLREQELSYAADDVRYLLPLLQQMRQELERQQRLEWFVEDCQRALTVQLEPDLGTLYGRLKGSGRLRGDAVHAALTLLDWRERRAQRTNRPRRWIMADSVLLQLAVQRPATRADLEQIDGLSGRTISKSGQSILAAIAERSDTEFSAYAERIKPEQRPDPEQLKLFARKVSDRATELGIHAEVIAAKKDITAVVLGKPPAHLKNGWRATILGL